ncbi:ATP-binding protein [Prevotella sp.]|uniref:ATP-binding protein n=1 Tax=Prevotella sp. TaxID=59823 RepID=UPI0030779153
MQKLHGPHKSLPANPLLADPMYWNGYIEKVGTGTEDIINKCREYGLKTPEFYQEEDFRVVIWRAYNEGSVPMMIQGRSKAFQSVPTDEERLLEAIKETPSISRAELSKRLNISERQVRKITGLLREKGILIREGGNSGKWIIQNI